MLSEHKTMYSLVWIALVVSLMATIPQLIQIVETKEARDFNTTSLYLSVLANLLIGAEAIRSGQTASLALSAWLVVFWLTILSYKLKPFE